MVRCCYRKSGSMGDTGEKNTLRASVERTQAPGNWRKEPCLSPSLLYNCIETILYCTILYAIQYRDSITHTTYTTTTTTTNKFSLPANDCSAFLPCVWHQSFNHGALRIVSLQWISLLRFSSGLKSAEPMPMQLNLYSSAHREEEKRDNFRSPRGIASETY